MKNSTFGKRLIKEIKPFIKEAISITKLPKGSKKRTELEQRTISSLFGERTKDDHLPLVKITPRKIYLKNILSKYVEIVESLDMMKLSVTFIIKGAKDKNIPRLKYIKYHYGNYLNELYIYSIRIKDLFDFIISKCQKAKKVKEVIKIQRIRTIFNKNIDNAKNIRGNHVHQKRYSNNKFEQIYQLDSLGEDFNFIREYGNHEFKELKKKTIKGMRDNIKVLDDFIEIEIHEHLGNIIFDEIHPNV